MRNRIFLLISFLLLSCAKEEFAPNKVPQNSSINPLATTSTTLCSDKTLVSPKVDILVLWDNTTSTTVITNETRNSYAQLIKTISERFDYHILSAPLVSMNTNPLFETTLVAKDPSSVTSDVSYIVRPKDQASTSLNFTPSNKAGFEAGVDRALSLLENNRANGIFRNDAYTLIVVVSNGDDTSCEIETNLGKCTTEWVNLLQNKIDRLLCLRGNYNGLNCQGILPLNSTMMRFINIAPLTSCSIGHNNKNVRYRKVATTLYSAPYSNGWPLPNDQINPYKEGSSTFPDNYDLCKIDFAHVFDGVNTSIQETLIRHVYSFWPVTGSNISIDPDTIKVTRDDGKVLANRTNLPIQSDGFAYIGNQTSHNTRTSPTPGEFFTGHMIQLFGANNNDLVVYPHCLSVTFDAMKTKYGYIYLKNGEPAVSTVEVKINGAIVPQSTSQGWDYMGLQSITALDPNLKIVDLPSGANSGFFIRLNGTYKIDNAVGTTVPVDVYYTSKAQ